LFWFQLGGSIFASFVNVWFGRGNVFRIEDWPKVLIIAIFGGSVHSVLVHVMRLEPNATIGLVICNLAIVWCFLLDTWYFGNPFLIWSGAGAIIITICSALIAL
jgi:drug/metabolite transporter (DMT)-like permease